MKSNLINNPEDWTGKNIQGENLAGGQLISTLSKAIDNIMTTRC
jgi:hypothetical protein